MTYLKYLNLKKILKQLKLQLEYKSYDSPAFWNHQNVINIKYQ